jgi:fumarate reductase subunit D
VNGQLPQPESDLPVGAGDQPQTLQNNLSQPQAKSQQQKATDENWLWLFELIMVGGLLVFILSSFVILLLWIFFGVGSEIYERFSETLKILNDNWKVCLLIFLPLFFRPLRKFLLNLKEGPWGLTSGNPMQPDKKPSEGVYKN